MNDKKNKIIISLAFISLFLVFVIVAFSNRIKINGITNVSNAKWDIYFSDLSTSVKVGDAVEIASPTLSSTTISKFSIALRRQKDSISYQFKVINNGTYDAKIDDIIFKNPTCLGNGTYKTSDEKIMCENFKYKLTYEDGSELKKGDILLVGEQKKLNLLLEFNSENSEKKELPKSDVSIGDIEVKVIYVQQ